ncbi:hypothetical protein Celaphus_00002873, partial [Cervus elaphus hippelaphus]
MAGGTRWSLERLDLFPTRCPQTVRKQLYNLSLRSLGESVSANEEENVDPWQAARASPQDSRNCEVTLKSLKAHPLHSTWSARSSPDCSTWDLPWISEELSPSFTQDHAGLAGKGRGSSREDQDTVELVPQGEPPCPAQQVRTVSKWEQCLMPLGNSSHLDTEPLTPLQRGLWPIQAAQAEQGTPRAQTPREEGLCRIPGAPQSPQTTHTPMPGPKRLCGRIPERSQGAGPWAEGAPLVKGVQARSSLVRLCDLFKTGEDFDDD